jgi:hypothetical protein
MKFFSVVAFGILVLGAASSAMAAGPDRIRGRVLSADGSTLIVKTNAGLIETIALAGTTAYAVASPATRADVAAGRYIGTATKTVNGRLVALEVTIFAPSMVGKGEGHYAWDNIPDTTVTGAGEVPTGVTNGHVMLPVLAKTTHSSMTNGNVTISRDLPGAVTAAGDKEIIVSYKGGSQTVLLPPTAPINNVAPADRTVIAKGAQVFVVAEPAPGGLRADYVVVATGTARLAM